MDNNENSSTIGYQPNILFGPMPFEPLQLYGIAFSSENVKIIDGDTLKLDNLKIRLLAIDAPETQQHCAISMDSGVPTNICAGGLARDQLSLLINNSRVDCTNGGVDLYNRQLSFCDANGVQLNREMVKQGFAYAYMSKLFVGDEADARLYKRGLWAGEQFDPPWELRKSKRK